MLFHSKSASDQSLLIDGGLLCRRSAFAFALAATAFLGAAVQEAAAGSLEDAAENPNQLSLATAIETVCPILAGMGGFSLTGDIGDLFDRCNGAINPDELPSDPQAEILADIASEEINAQRSSIDGTVAPQTRAVAGRLSAFSKGGGIGFAQAGPGNLASGPQYASNSDWQFAASDDGVSGTSLSGLGFFFNGSYNFGEKDETSLEAGFDFDDYSITGGVDYFFTDNFVAGVAFGYGYTSVDFDGGAGDLSTYGYTGSIYAFFNPFDQFGVTGLLSASSLDFDSKRNLDYMDANAVVFRTAEGGADANSVELSATAYYDFTMDSLTYGPTGRISYNSLEIDGFTENGGGGLDITYPDQRTDSLVTALGGAATYALSTDYGVTVFQARGEWVHEYLNDGDSVLLFYAADPSATGFILSSDSPDRDRFNVGGGVSMLFAGGVSAFADFETVLGHDDVTSYTFTGGFRYEFN